MVTGDSSVYCEAVSAACFPGLMWTEFEVFQVRGHRLIS
jgi:hypothetical protein